MKVWLFGLSAGLAFVLFNTIGLPQSEQAALPQAENPAYDQDYEEMFSEGSTNGVVYIDWQTPKGTNGFFGPAWFLGAYKYASEGLCIDLCRKFLSNDVYYAIHYSYRNTAGPEALALPITNGSNEGAALFLKLLDTNWVMLAESENLLTSTNVAHYVFTLSDEESTSTNTVLLVHLPTAEYPSAAVIQTVDDDSETVTVLESLLFIDDGSGLWSTDWQGNGATNYPGGNILSNYYDWVKGNTNGSSTNNPGDVPPPPPPPPEDNDKDKGIVYVDQKKGNDNLTGRAPDVSANKGPKKTVRGGLSIAETNDTIIIKSGAYNENLDIRGKDLKVFIEGNVRL